MTTSIDVEAGNPVSRMTSTAAESTVVGLVHRKRTTSRSVGVSATALVALVAAVVLFGLAFPQLLAPAIAIAVLAAIVALDLLLPSRDLRQAPGIHWMR